MKPCLCGCGEMVPPLNKAGQPRKGFVHGHAVRMQRPGSGHAWKGDAAGYSAIHLWLRTTYPKAGVCESCSAAGPTEYASIGHTYTRDRADYRELCDTCHGREDGRYTLESAA